MSSKEGVKARLEAIATANGGLLTTDAVIEDAKSEASPLHGYFTWDVQEAAYRCWQEEARDLIRSVKIEITTSERVVSTVCYVQDPSSNNGGYVQVAALRDEKMLAKATLIRELRQARALFERAYSLAEALGLSEEFDEFAAKLEAINLKLAA